MNKDTFCITNWPCPSIQRQCINPYNITPKVRRYSQLTSLRYIAWGWWTWYLWVARPKLSQFSETGSFYPIAVKGFSKLKSSRQRNRNRNRPYHLHVIGVAIFSSNPHWMQEWLPLNHCVALFIVNSGGNFCRVTKRTVQRTEPNLSEMIDGLM